MAKPKKKQDDKDVKTNESSPTVLIDQRVKETFTVQAKSSLIRNEVFEGKSHIAVPVAMIAEGVHNKILYTNEELSKHPQAWDGEPVPVFHPVRNGKPVSANRPDVLEKDNVGRVFNTEFRISKNTGKLLSELWIDPERADEVNKRVMEIFNAGEKMEVSTGMFIDLVEEEGEWNGEEYEAIATNIRPDHLALLPDGLGACSWEDGGGAPRNNAAAFDDNRSKEEGGTRMKVTGAMLSRIANGETPIATNELSFSQVHQALLSLLRDEANENKPPNAPYEYSYVDEVYEGYFVYSVEKDGKMKFFKRGYSVDKATDEVALADKSVEVKRQVSYVPVTGSNDSGSPMATNNRGEESMKERGAKIDTLIEAGIYNEEQREGLTALEDSVFDPIFALHEEATKDTTPAPEEPKDPETLEAAVEATPEEFRGVINEGLELRKEQRTAMIADLTANDACEFTAEELEGKSTTELTKLSKLCKKEEAPAPENNTQKGDYSLQAPAGSPTDNGKEEALSSPTLNWDEDK